MNNIGLDEKTNIAAIVISAMTNVTVARDSLWAMGIICGLAIVFGVWVYRTERRKK